MPTEEHSESAIQQHLVSKQESDETKRHSSSSKAMWRATDVPHEVSRRGIHKSNCSSNKTSALDEQLI
jgi:hypothetical protein